MITIKIANEEREAEPLDEQWINQQIEGRKAAGEVVCVRVTIRTYDVEISLSTPTCPRGGGVSRLNDQESKLVDLWNDRGLKDSNFTGGNLIAFLKQLKQIL